MVVSGRTKNTSRSDFVNVPLLGASIKMWEQMQNSEYWRTHFCALGITGEGKW